MIEENFSGIVGKSQCTGWDRRHGIAVIHHTEMSVVHAVSIADSCARFGEGVLIVGERSRHSKRHQTDMLRMNLVNLARGNLVGK